MDEKKPKFDFYEKVRICTTEASRKEVNGELAAVVGRAQDDFGSWSYAVHIYRTEVVWSVSEDELISLGEFDSEDNFFDGSSVRVRVDRKGRGIRID
jgi:Immunity protein 31